MLGRRYVVVAENDSTKNIYVHDQSITVYEFKKKIHQEFNIHDHFLLYCGEQQLNPQAKLKDLDVGTMKNPIRIKLTSLSEFVSGQVEKSMVKNSLVLPPLVTQRETTKSRNTVIQNEQQIYEFPNRYSKLGQLTSRASSTINPTPFPTNHSTAEKSTNEKSIDENSLNKNNLQNESISSTYEPDFETNNVDDYDDDDANSSTISFRQSNKSSSESSFHIPNIVSDNITETDVKQFELRIRSLRRIYNLTVSESFTMKMLIHKLWNQLPNGEDPYDMDSHVLLLFNHRFHVFVEDSPEELVKDFFTLSLNSYQTHFYLYGLPKEYKEHMYYYKTSHEDLFNELDPWYPTYFKDEMPLERSLSILLSSFYAFKSYLDCEDPNMIGFRQCMKAQFFIQLRKYLYPPAIIAFKHLLQGCMFVFEQTLLADSLLQLLEKLCPGKLYGVEISCSEYFDFIPALICWILDEWDPEGMDEDFFRLINIRESPNNSIPSDIHTVDGDVSEIKDADIRCLHRHLTQSAFKRERMMEFYNRYEIYDPDEEFVWDLTQVKPWSQDEINSIYKTMMHRYRNFRVFTRDAITSNVSNQLVLLEEERTVSVLLSRMRHNMNSRNRDDGIDHSIQIFNPLNMENNIARVSIGAIINGENSCRDPRLPRYFSSYLVTEPIDMSPSECKTLKPAEQVTIILLDLSKSMFDCSITCDGSETSDRHINICSTLLSRLSDNMLPKRESHALGLIEYGDGVHVKCPITREKDKFDLALKSLSPRGNWTCLYDAVSEAITRIERYMKSPIRVTRNCKKLIICFSDGMNNAGHVSLDNVQKRIIEQNIVLDFISFLPENEVHNKKKLRAIDEFRQLCSKSGGYIYSHLSSRSEIELASLFEQEASFWLWKRANDSCGIVEMPKHYVNPIFRKEAVRQPELREHHTNSFHSASRILKEFQTIQQLQTKDFIVYMVVDSISHWKVILKGPEQTVYANKFWMLFVEFNSSYPEFPPDVRFITPIYHMNITGDGKICNAILDRLWTKRTTMVKVFESIIELLKQRSFSDAISIEKAILFQENEMEYGRQAKEHTECCAKDSIKSLIIEYQLLNAQIN